MSWWIIGIWIVLLVITMRLSWKLGQRVADSRISGLPLRCALGFHSWYLDSALIFSVRRCNFCKKPDNDFNEQALQRERDMWTRIAVQAKKKGK